MKRDYKTSKKKLRKSNKAMDDTEIVSYLGRKISQAMNDESGDLSDTRQDTFDRYIGEKYGNERDGYSSFVTRETLETIEWVLPSVLRVFLSDKVVTFDAVNADDEAQADQETDIVNHKVMKANNGDGFLALHHFFKDSLMYPNGYIKVYVDEEETTKTHRKCGLTAMALQIIEADEDNEILEYDSYMKDVPLTDSEVLMYTQQGVKVPPDATREVELFDITYRSVKQSKKLKIDPVPGEEALVDNDCTSTNLDTADFSCHRVKRSYSQLVRLGFNRDDLDDVGSYEDYDWSDERTGRLFYEDEDAATGDDDDPSMRSYWVHECHVHMDVDGDGLSEFRNIVLIGAKIFVNEEVDHQPLVAMSSILMPHKHNGMSFADIVKDLQKLNTTLTRQLLDNIYRINVRRKLISQDALLDDGSTLDAMLNVAAEWIPVKGPASNAQAPEVTQSIIGDILPVIKHIDESKGNRTGINPQVNLDPNVLQKSTAGAFMGALEQASQRVEMLVRIFAETGIKQLMRKVHNLVRSYPDMTTTIKLRGDWVDFDAGDWDERTDLTVNVGLGFNNKQQQIAMLTSLLDMQKEALPSGMASASEIYNTLEKLIEAGDLGSVNQYFNDPDSPDFEAPEPAPDPGVVLAQAQADVLVKEQERKTADMQHKHRLEVSEQNRKAQENLRKLEFDRDKALSADDVRRSELELKRIELEIRQAESEAIIDNKNADTDLKDEQALKTRLEGMEVDKRIDDPQKQTSPPMIDNINEDSSD